MRRKQDDPDSLNGKYIHWSDPRQWRVFEGDGGSSHQTLGSGSGDPPVDQWIPTGRTLGTYRTLADAQAAHPDARVSLQARKAIEAGNR